MIRRYVSVSSDEFSKVVKPITDAYLKAQNVDACIEFVEKLEYPRWFVERLESYKDSMPLHRIVEGVYHGTKAASIPSILRDGFQEKYNKTSAYGHGTYFAANPTMSMESYTNIDKSTESSFVFVCDLIVGKIGRSGEDVDTWADVPEKPSIYVARRDEAIMPRYLVGFYKQAHVEEVKRARGKR